MSHTQSSPRLYHLAHRRCFVRTPPLINRLLPPCHLSPRQELSPLDNSSRRATNCQSGWVGPKRTRYTRSGLPRGLDNPPSLQEERPELASRFVLSQRRLGRFTLQAALPVFGAISGNLLAASPDSTPGLLAAAVVVDLGFFDTTTAVSQPEYPAVCLVLLRRHGYWVTGPGRAGWCALK